MLSLKDKLHLAHLREGNHPDSREDYRAPGIASGRRTEVHFSRHAPLGPLTIELRKYTGDKPRAPSRRNYK